MQAAFAELPLAVFTTLAPIGAAGFIVFAMIAFTTEFAGEGAQRVDKMSLVPFIVSLVGFIASVFHLANPLAAFGALAGIGRSPLTNEVVVGAVFMVAALVYVALAYAGKLSGARKPLAAAVAVLAVVFCVFVGLAYMIPTVSSWNSALLPIEVVGYALVGGCAFGALALAGQGSEAGAAGKALRVAAIAGAVVAIVAVAAQLAMLAGANTAVASGQEIVATAAPFAVIGLVLVAVSAAELVRGFAKGMTKAIAVRSLVEVVLGAFLVRLAFYAMYLSVGVTPL